MRSAMPETRPLAPGALRVVQEFLNSGHLDDRPLPPLEVIEAIGSRRADGWSQAALASDFGISRRFVAAVSRGASVFDELPTAEAATSWLIERALLAPGERIDEAGLERLRDLRGLLRQLAAANNGAGLDPEVPPALGRLAARAPFVLGVDEDGQVSLEPAKGGVDGAIARLLGIVYDAMQAGTFQRLKRCPGEGCPHTFYDASRNRTGTWCSMSVCGNRTKVRSYQSRRRAARTG